jgi:hypothetical protein
MGEWRWGLACVLVSAVLALGGCGKKQTLEQAIDCGQFHRLTNGSWSTDDVSLDYVRDGRQIQTNLDKGTVISATSQGEFATVFAAVNQKCGAHP